MTPMAHLENRRSMHRRRMLKSVKLLPLGKVTLFDGVARDYSSSGARIRLEDPTLIPRKFELRFAKSDEVQHSRVIWRSHDEIGVEFH